MEKNLHFWWSNLNRNDLNKTYLQRAEQHENFAIKINDDFKGCLDYYRYNITTRHTKNESMEDHVACFIVNGDDEICTWRWIEGQNQFNISLTDIKSTEILRTNRIYDVAKFDILGYIRCRIKDEKHFRDIIFDLPFVVTHPNSSNDEAFSEAPSKDPAQVLKCALFFFTIASLIIITLIFTIWNYKSRKKRISDRKRIKARYVLNLLKILIFDIFYNTSIHNIFIIYVFLKF